MAPTPYYTRDTPAFTGFQPEPAGRGTKGIIWTCLSTILLSSWSSYHGAAYDPNEPFKEEARGSYIWRFIVAFLLPEFGAAESFDSFYDALQLRKTIRQVGGAEFANFSLTQAFLVVMSCVYQRPPDPGKVELVRRRRLLELVSSGSFSVADFPTDDEIADKSKRDWTLKSLSIIQTAWFLVSIIVRLSRGYPVCLFEDITVANAFCGVIGFVCWFHCPQDIRLPFIIKLDTPGMSNGPSAAAESEEPEEEATAEALLVSEDANKNEVSSGRQASVTEGMTPDRCNTKLPISKRPSLIRKETKHRASFATQPVEFKGASKKAFVIVLVVFSVVFAGIHIAAWNYSFPSFAEAWIWRGGSLALTVLGVLIALSSHVTLSGDFDTESAWNWVFLLCLTLYSLVRTMMLGVALASFRKAPARLYETPSWTQYWPHI